MSVFPHSGRWVASRLRKLPASGSAYLAGAVVHGAHNVLLETLGCLVFCRSASLRIEYGQLLSGTNRWIHRAMRGEVITVSEIGDSLWSKWRRVPGPLRKSAVLLIGLTLLAIGGVLIVLPGPFTLPFVVAALAVLASEFVWAERVFRRGKDVTKSAVGTLKRVPNGIIGAAFLLIVSGVAITFYWWISHR